MLGQKVVDRMHCVCDRAMFLFCNARIALEFGLLCLMVEKSTGHMLEREKELHLYHGKKMLQEKLERC